MMDVFPIPPAPISAIGVRRFAERTILSISSSHPQKILGVGGGSTPDTLDTNIRRWIAVSAAGIANLL